MVREFSAYQMSITPKNKQKQKQNVSSVMHDQVEQARQVLVGKSKSYREQYETLSKEGAAN